ncbi:MAG: long-chain-fatty-acid--CoA ligase [Paracoccaceae bacterium]
MAVGMQDFPLTVGKILDHAAKYHTKRKIISRSIEGPITKTNWGEVQVQAKKVSQALISLGIRTGDVIGVMAWNTSRHLEVWYGVPGAGAVNHTLNPRLFADQLVYIINHAEDRFLIIDFDLIPIIEGIWDRLTTVEKVIVMTNRAHMPQSSIPDLICYEELLEPFDGNFDWVELEETSPCGICYTSGTTGDPKGVIYTHRSNTLHALAASAPDMLGLSSNDVAMPVVPLFHANGWSIAYSAPLVGSGLVMPGRDMTPAALFEMLDYGVTFTAAVPTIWMLMLQHLQANDLHLPALERVLIGGSSCPRAVIETFQNDYGVQVLHAWGMTEMSPLGTICTFKPEITALDAVGRLDAQGTTGHPPYSIDLRITDDTDQELPWDGQTQGKLWAKGVGVLQRYLKHDEDAVDKDGWFDTGDVATIDENGYIRITDRSKDVIKSGGEWISSISLENAAIAHPEVAEAAAIGIAHPKWDERPILVIVAMPNKTPDANDILDLVGKSFAKWQVPDDVVFLDELPHTATGKISKLELRKILITQNYKLPE